MFDTYCTTYRSRVLRSDGSILSLHNTSLGRVLYYRCACGGLGVLVEGRDVADELRRGACVSAEDASLRAKWGSVTVAS